MLSVAELIQGRASFLDANRVDLLGVELGLEHRGDGRQDRGVRRAGLTDAGKSGCTQGCSQIWF